MGARAESVEMMRKSVTAVAVCAAVILFSAKAQAAPLDDLLAPKAGVGACFTRAYDDAHLRQHPRQNTTFIAAWMKYEKMQGGDELALGFSLALRRRGERDALFSQGVCSWEAQANRDTSNNRLIQDFPKEEGAVCMQSAHPDVFESLTAEEGGNLIFDRGKDKNTLAVYLQDSLTMVKRANRSRHLHITFDTDDRVFILRRASARNCAFIEEAVTTQEPGPRDRRR
jgi:hypothetical protein